MLAKYRKIVKINHPTFLTKNECIEIGNKMFNSKPTTSKSDQLTILLQDEKKTDIVSKLLLADLRDLEILKYNNTKKLKFYSKTLFPNILLIYTTFNDVGLLFTGINMIYLCCLIVIAYDINDGMYKITNQLYEKLKKQYYF